jgi:hypothetical protein
MPADKVAGWSENFKLPEDMVQWKDITLNIEDFPVALAYTQHNDWIDKVLELNRGADVSIDAGRVKDWKECPFGRWYYGTGVKYKQIKEYKEIGRVHKSLHLLAYKNLTLTLEGKYEEAEPLVKKIEKTRKKLSRLLFSLAKIIAKK